LSQILKKDGRKRDFIGNSVPVSQCVNCELFLKNKGRNYGELRIEKSVKKKGSDPTVERERRVSERVKSCYNRKLNKKSSL